MAQQKQLSWTDLRVGVFVLAGLVLTGITIFYVTGGHFWGAKYRLITYMPEVNQLATGAPVDLDGILVGNVQSFSFTPRPQDEDHAVTIVMQIDKRFQSQIRTDSSASLATQGLLGDRYVSLTRGLTGTVISNNGIVQTKGSVGTQEVIERSAQLMASATKLTNDLQQTIEGINRGQGSLGKFMKDPSLYNHIDATVEKVDAMASSIQQGQGSIGKLYASDDIYNKADSAVGKIDDAMSAVKDQKGTLGKAIYDPALYQHINSISANADAMLSDARQGKGTFGKLATDDALYNNVRDASANLRDVTAKLNSNQGTAGKFFTDPALYDNLTGLTGDMQLMINDFRKNPKKFLHVKLGLF